MPNYQCYILDDEPLAIKVIEQYLAKFEQCTLCGRSTDPLQALGELSSLQPELLFLDIEMPDLNGLELIESLSFRPQIILTTAYREYAVEGFEREVLDYLVKPIPFPRFVKAMNRFLQRPHLTPTTTATATATATTNTPSPYLLIRVDRKTVKLPIDDICYVQGVKDYVKILLSDQSILTKTSLGNFHQLLPQHRFLRVHKSYVVAIDKITAFTNYDVEIGEQEIPIGRTYKEDFLRAMRHLG